MLLMINKYGPLEQFKCYWLNLIFVWRKPAFLPPSPSFFCFIDLLVVWRQKMHFPLLPSLFCFLDLLVVWWQTALFPPLRSFFNSLIRLLFGGNQHRLLHRCRYFTAFVYIMTNSMDDRKKHSIVIKKWKSTRKTRTPSIIICHLSNLSGIDLPCMFSGDRNIFCHLLYHHCHRCPDVDDDK